MAEPVVQIKGVSRAFANVVALDNFDLEVPPGTVTALLGPNGAGKTTTVRVITGGLDPESARAVLALIDEMATGGKTVLLCTHLLLEAEGLADQVVVMDQGHALIAGPPAELSKRFWPNLVVLLDAEDRETLDEAKIFEGVLAYERNGHATIQIDDLARIPNLIAYMSARGVRLTRVEPHVPTLEDLYFAVRNKTRPAVFKRSQTPKSTEQDR